MAVNPANASELAEIAGEIGADARPSNSRCRSQVGERPLYPTTSGSTFCESRMLP
jgi:hypothetical protein